MGPPVTPNLQVGLLRHGAHSDLPKITRGAESLSQSWNPSNLILKTMVYVQQM